MSQSPPESWHSDAYQKDHPHDSGPVLRPPAREVVQEPTTKGQKHNPRRKRRWTKEPALLVVNILTLLVLLAYTCYTRRMVLDGENSSRQQSRAVAKQLAEMKESNRINNLALVAVQRAIISIATPIMIDMQDPHDPSKVLHELAFKWTNSGNTPPDGVAMRFSYLPSPTELNDPWRAAKWNSLPDDVIAPHDSIEAGGYYMSRSDSSDYANRRAYFYAMAEVSYGDAFGSPERHVTQFCAAYHGLGGQVSQRTREVHWQSCSSHNCTDRKCIGQS